MLQFSVLMLLNFGWVSSCLCFCDGVWDTWLMFMFCLVCGGIIDQVMMVLLCCCGFSWWYKWYIISYIIDICINLFVYIYTYIFLKKILARMFCYFGGVVRKPLAFGRMESLKLLRSIDAFGIIKRVTCTQHKLTSAAVAENVFVRNKRMEELVPTNRIAGTN